MWTARRYIRCWKIRLFVRIRLLVLFIFAMKQCCKYIRGIQYKLGPAYIFGDNKSILCNTTISDSLLNKNPQSIAYHFVIKGAERDEQSTAYMNTHENQAKKITKMLPMSKKWRVFIQMLQHHIFGSFTEAPEVA